MAPRHATTTEERERKGRRALAWGGGILLLGFLAGWVLAFIPIATGFRIAYFAAELDFVFPIATAIVCGIGLGLVIYGLVVLSRTKRDGEPRPA
ncbi:MAG: hypothetical protein M5U28_50760 [Sandaracinaceae bacterium]|nr:hypothetical protein [Sandaracinaceae bacterium]